MDKTEMIMLPGQFSDIKISTRSSMDVVQKGSNSHGNALSSNSDTILMKALSSPINGPTCNSEAFSSLAKIDEEHTKPSIDTDWENDCTDYGLDESEPETDEESEGETEEEDPEYVKEWKRKFEYYNEMLHKTCEKQREGRAQGTTKRKADEPCSEMLSETETKIIYHNYVLNEYFNQAMKKAKIQGYVYGIVLQNNKVLSGCSENLSKWWKETIKFEQSGPAAANQYFAENQETIEPFNMNQPQQNTRDSLMQLPDVNMGAAYMPCTT